VEIFIDYYRYFSSNSHSQWLNTYFGVDTTPVTYLYTLGNPLIGQAILHHDLRAGLNIPLRLLVTEDDNHLTTKIIYHLPSSVIPPGANAQLKELAEDLDKTLDKLVTEITSVERRNALPFLCSR
jgi:uncharacterized protein (DUF302 family)